MLGLYQPTIMVARYGGRIEIGDGFGISGSTIYSTASITIGKNATIGANCKIIDNDFHPLDAEQRKLNKIEHIKRSPIKIGDNCFVGMNSIILKGTTLGNNVVVGAGSVVHGTFPDNCIIAGNPAKIIRQL
jgi:acetyltransferase-like isoleucine patch superfamily enzyme